MKSQLLKKQTTYFIIVFSLIALIQNSCKKDNDEDEAVDKGSYMISFKANGHLEEFSSDNFLVCAFYDDGTHFTGQVSGTRSSSKVGVEVHDNTAIVETVYSGYKVTQASQTPAYVEGAAIVYQEGQAIYLTDFDNPEVTVRITKITSTSVSGTFSGTLKSSGKADIIVTEGKFTVPLGNISS